VSVALGIAMLVEALVLLWIGSSRPSTEWLANGSGALLYQRIVSGLIQQGAEGVILGCTEIGLLLRPQDAETPLFDTADIHAEEAARYALAT
jgi:hypothetical protein